MRKQLKASMIKAAIMFERSLRDSVAYSGSITTHTIVLGAYSLLTLPDVSSDQTKSDIVDT